MTTSPTHSQFRRVPRGLLGLALVLIAGSFSCWVFVPSNRRAAPLAAERPVPSSISDTPATPPTQVMIPSAPGTLASDSADDLDATLHDISGLLPDQREVALTSLFSDLAEHNHAAAAAAALTLAEPANRNIAWLAVVHQWALADPASLAAYVRNFPVGPSRQIALEAAITRWLEKDPQSARAWVECLPSAPENDSAIAVVALQSSLVASEPTLALDWAESVHDPALRSRTLGGVIRHWGVTCPEAAKSYARNSPNLMTEECDAILAGGCFDIHP